jgi:4-diphosphocytidyl-2C-methyl-D-erythritol kinase
MQEAENNKLRKFHAGFPDAQVKAPAKINLLLKVLAGRDDGYHEIVSVMQAVGLYDVVSIQIDPARAGAGLCADTPAGKPQNRHADDNRHWADAKLPVEEAYVSVACDNPEETRVRVTCDNPDVPADESNLACRAARLFLEWRARQANAQELADCSCVSRQGVLDFPSAEDVPGFPSAGATNFPSAASVHIHIEKHIPMAAGLAGGSADAAAVLLALAWMSGAQASLPELAEIGSALGADVAFCVLSCAAANPELGWAEEARSAALAEGVGERLTPLRTNGGFVLLVKPDVSVPTAEIYKAFDEVGGEACGGIRSAEGGNGICGAEAREVRAGSFSASEPVAGSQKTEAETLGKELADGIAAAVFRNMHNDLERVTCLKYPVVAEVIEKMRNFCEAPAGGGIYAAANSNGDELPRRNTEAHCRQGAAANSSNELPKPCLAAPGRVLMSGSGPTVFAYFFGEADARAAFAKARAAFPDMQVFLASAL